MARRADDQSFKQALAEKELHRRLKVFMHKPMTLGTMQAIDTMVHDFAVDQRKRGVDFPQLTAIIVPERGLIRLAARDLDQKGIGAHILSLVRLCPQITKDELARAIRRAWPDYNPEIIERTIQ